MDENERDEERLAARRRWREFGIPAVLVLAGAAAVVLLTWGLRPRPQPAEPEVLAAPLPWPPVPDSAAPGPRAPVETPLTLGVPGESSQNLTASYTGTLTLDESDLVFRASAASRVEKGADWQGGDLLLDSIVFGIAEPDPSGWRLAKRATAYIPDKAGYELPDSFVVSDVRPIDLVDRWPVLVHHYRAPRFADRKDLFASVLAVQGKRDDFLPILEATFPSEPRPASTDTVPRTLPLTVNAELVDANPADGATVSYRAVLTLDRAGLRYASNNGFSNPYSAHLWVDSTLQGAAKLEAVTFALAERAPWGWRIAKSFEVWSRRGYQGMNHWRPPGQELGSRPDTLLIPGVVAADLRGRWPVVIHDLSVTGPDKDATQGVDLTHIQVFSRGDPAVFEALLEPKPWEVQK